MLSVEYWIFSHSQSLYFYIPPDMETNEGQFHIFPGLCMKRFMNLYSKRNSGDVNNDFTPAPVFFNSLELCSLLKSRRAQREKSLTETQDRRDKSVLEN